MRATAPSRGGHLSQGDIIMVAHHPSYPVPTHDVLPSLDFVIEEWPRLQTEREAWADAATDIDRQVPSNHGLSATLAFMPGRSLCTW